MYDSEIIRESFNNNCHYTIKVLSFEFRDMIERLLFV